MLGALVWATLYAIAPVAHAADLAVVIDDVGYSNARGQQAIYLPGPITVAVLPLSPHGAALAADAQAMGHDIIVHQPMQSQPSHHARTEHGTLTMDMDAAEFDAQLNRALNAIPQTMGLSNHTGSLLTRHRRPMLQVMSHLISRGLFFLDSRTTHETVALSVAQELGVPSVRRDVFLDHDPTPRAVHAAFERALGVARKKGHAVLIGHPYPVSLNYLQSRLSNLPSDIRLVGVSTLASTPERFSHPAMLARKPDPESPRISLGR